MKISFLYIVATWFLAARETRKSKRQQRVVATEMTRGQHSTFGRLTYPTCSFLRSSAPASSSSPSTYIFPRERESFALIAPRARGDEVTVLFVCHPPATCLALSLNIRVREGKRQLRRETVPRRDAQLRYGRFPATADTLIRSIAWILFSSLREKKNLQSLLRRAREYFNFSRELQWKKSRFRNFIRVSLRMLAYNFEKTIYF